MRPATAWPQNGLRNIWRDCEGTGQLRLYRRCGAVVEKMKFISIVGPKEEIDRVTSQYLSGTRFSWRILYQSLKILKISLPVRTAILTGVCWPGRKNWPAASGRLGTLRRREKGMETQAAVALTEELYAELEKCRAQKSGLEAERKKLWSCW